MHLSVMAKEIVDLLVRREGGTFVDGTLGNGGHARAILERAGPAAHLLGLDRDEEALGRAAQTLADRAQQSILVHANFDTLHAVAAAQGITAADGVLLDLGVSSDQLDTAGRGFSFMKDGPLDMRMDRTQAFTAADLVNTWSESELAECIRANGEEPMARRIAAAIVRERTRAPLQTTRALADLVERTVGRRGRIHPATRTFQAVRMAVNDELGAIERGLEAGLGLLKPGGRMAVITFHSLEDRAVKQCFVRHAGRMEALAAGGEVWRGEEPKVSRVTRKPLVAGEAELAENPRARSAKLRVVERLT